MLQVLFQVLLLQYCHSSFSLPSSLYLLSQCLIDHLSSSIQSSAPCGVILRHSSFRTLQRSGCACALLLSLIALQQGHPSVAPIFSMFCIPGLSICRLSFSKVLQLRVGGFFVPSALRFQPSDFTSSEYTICISNETFRTVVSHSKPNPELVSGIRSVHGIFGDLFCQHVFAKMGHILCRFLCHAVFRMAFSRHELFDIWTEFILHVPPTMAE